MPRPHKNMLLAAPGIVPAGIIAALDEAIARLVEQRNEVARHSPFNPPLIQVTEVRES